MTRIDHSRQSVTLGGLPLMVDGEDVESEEGYTFRVVGDDATLGDAEQVVSVLMSMLTDGSIIHLDRDDNRQPSFIVEIECPFDDGLALARGEAALRAVCKRPVELVWGPPQAGALPAVFDVVNSTFDLLYSDLDEGIVVRAYRIGMSALPYARSHEETVFTAEPVPPADGVPALTTINNCDTTAGWSSPVDTVTDVGSAIRVTGDSGATLLRTVGVLTTAAGAFTAKPYVVFEYRLGPYSSMTVRVPDAFGGFPLTKVISFTQSGGWVQAWWRIPDSVDLDDLTGLVFEQDVSPIPVPAASWFEIRDVSAAASAATVGTNRQLLRNLNIGGTETTQGSIDIVHPTTDLGDVLVYVRHAGEAPYVPSISPYTTGGVSTPGNVSGLQFSDDTLTFVIPADAIPPGEYHVVARINREFVAQPMTVTMTAESRLGGSAVVEGAPIVNQVTAPADTWVLRSLGSITLPPAPIGSSGEVALEIAVTSGGFDASIEWDEVWLCHEDGTLTIVEGVDRPRLSIISPNLDNEGNGAIWASEDADLTVAYSVASKCLARDHHDLEPGDNMLLTVTTGVGGAPASATAYKRFSHFPSDV
jgi:hypothetical protein